MKRPSTTRTTKAGTKAANKKSTRIIRAPRAADPAGVKAAAKVATTRRETAADAGQGGKTATKTPKHAPPPRPETPAAEAVPMPSRPPGSRGRALRATVVKLGQRVPMTGAPVKGVEPKRSSAAALIPLVSGVAAAHEPPDVLVPVKFAATAKKTPSAEKPAPVLRTPKPLPAPARSRARARRASDPDEDEYEDDEDVVVPTRAVTSTTKAGTGKTTSPGQVPGVDTTPAKRGRLVVGCMTGTSLDALDAALVRIHGHGLALRVELLSGIALPLGPVGAVLRRLAEQEPLTAGEIAMAQRNFALLHLDAVRALAEDAKEDPVLIAVHGQTVFHKPPVSWQVFQPWPLALGCGAAVVCDLRAADLAAGGQGAPITPLADWLMLRHPRETRVIANLGGFCNLTVLPAGNEPAGVSGRDICACNQVLDALARRLLGCAYDRDGGAALSGTADSGAVRDLVAKLEVQARAGRSLGTGDEIGAWIAERFSDLPPADLLRSACAAVATVITRAAAEATPKRLILAGGGVRNRALAAEVRARAGIAVEPSDRHGVPPALREAMAMAVLGALCQDRVPITLASATGVEEAPIAGVWAVP